MALREKHLEVALLNLQSMCQILQWARDAGHISCTWERWGEKGCHSLWGYGSSFLRTTPLLWRMGWTKLGVQLVRGPVPAGSQHQQFHCHNIKCSCGTLNLCITMQIPVICLFSWWRSTLHYISATKRRCHLFQYQWKPRCCVKFNKWPSYRWVFNFLKYSKSGFL